MGYKPIQFAEEAEQEVMQWKPPSLGGGICLKDLEQNLLDDQSPKLLNVWFLNSILAKRYGQEWTLAADITNKPITLVLDKRYKGYIIFACDTNIYKLDTTTKTVTLIMGGLSSLGCLFVMNDILYYFSKGNKFTNLITNGNFPNTTGWSSYLGYTTLGAASNELTCTGNSTGPFIGAVGTSSIVASSGKFVYVSLKVKSSSIDLNSYRLRLTGTTSGNILASTRIILTGEYNQYITMSAVVDVSSLVGNINVIVYGVYGSNNNYSTYVKEVVAIDLDTNSNNFTQFQLDSLYQAFSYFTSIDTSLLKYDGTTMSIVTPYVPVTFTATPPSGGGTALEEDNRAGAGQTNRFSPTGGAAFQLSKSGLDSTLCTAVLSGVTKVETVDFNVNRTTGLVTFVSSPTAGTNTLEITFYKTNSSIINDFIACTKPILYGDAKETVFFGRNAKGNIYWSDVNLPHYIPLSNTKLIGDAGDDVTGFGIQYDTLVVFKSRILISANKVTTSTLAEFAFAIVNDSIGCDMPNTIQLINNRLTWCNTYGGVYTLTSTLIKDERNVKPISDNVNGTDFRSGIFAETLIDLQNASSCDWKKYNQYWLCIGDKVYMWDYGLRPYIDSGDLAADQKRLSWWIFNNINANCFFNDGDDMYFGDRTVGNFAHLINQFNDFGNSINAVYRVPLRDFGINDWYKTIQTMTVTSRADTNTKININYINERDSRLDPQPIILTSFSWAHFSWATFSWSVINFGKSFTRYPNSKHVLYWSVEFENNDVGRDLSIIALNVLWTRSKKIR